uniref:Uncharacterized protein n=1 Tax=Cacopsylla melanoneura TaxID=428564 RepID=A0A8D8ZL86_9HEMI
MARVSFRILCHFLHGVHHHRFRKRLYLCPGEEPITARVHSSSVRLHTHLHFSQNLHVHIPRLLHRSVRPAILFEMDPRLHCVSFPRPCFVYDVAPVQDWCRALCIETSALC